MVCAGVLIIFRSHVLNIVISRRRELIGRYIRLMMMERLSLIRNTALHRMSLRHRHIVLCLIKTNGKFKTK